jgi:hypothetical protein
MLMYGCPHQFELDTIGVAAPWISALRVRRTHVVDTDTDTTNSDSDSACDADATAACQRSDQAKLGAPAFCCAKVDSRAMCCLSNPGANISCCPLCYPEFSRLCVTAYQVFNVTGSRHYEGSEYAVRGLG